MARERLVRFLEWRGWSQERMAESLGVAQATVSKLVHGRKRPGVPGHVYVSPGLTIALAIERVTAEPNEHGVPWPEPAIRPEEWVPLHVGRPLADADTDTDVAPKPRAA